MHATDAYAIETRDLVKEYPGGDGVHGLTLRIPEGCAFGLLGPNGAGKSTTIKMLMGLLPPTSGEARVLGISVRENAVAIRRGVGYVPERHFIYPWMRISEVIWFTRAFYPTWDDAYCAELLTHYALDPAKRVRELSQGMLTKLALVLALAHDPDLLLLDEPTTGLDALIREEFLDGISGLLRERPRTVLLSSHIMSDVEKVADTIGIVNRGVLLVCARKDELVARTKRVDVTLRAGHAATTPPEGTVWQERSNGAWRMTVHGFSSDTVQRITQQNAVERCDVRDLSLEDIFKDFIKGARQT